MLERHISAERAQPTLYVDLDGTLTPADVSIEAFVSFARAKPLNGFMLLFWLLKGRAFAKAMVARRMPLNASALPIRPAVLELIEKERASGRRVVLASASHVRNVRRVARHLGLFDDVIATSAKRNIKGREKLRAIREAEGGGDFHYVGDCKADLPLWASAGRGYSVRHRPRHHPVEMLVAKPSSSWRAVLKAMRPHQWAKNALVFVPVLTAGLASDTTALARAGLAAVLFSFLASGVYLLNDVVDIDADRAHATKFKRPVASGALSVPAALAIAAILMTAPIAAAAMFVGPALALVLLVYLVLTTAYSLRLKAVMTLDVITLACLYTIRIFAGSVAVGVTTSFWLFTFSVFLFLSLAYLKRYTELAFKTGPDELVKGRGYLPSDLEMITIAGMAAGMTSILVLALFINAAQADPAYRTPDILWLLCLLLLYWINRVWMMARRGEVEGDPVAFAMRDRRSLVVGALMGVVVLTAQELNLQMA